MYESFYKLEKTPFSATPDPDFFFTSAGHREALAALIYGIQYRKGFISLIGEVGTGKTTVLRSYIHSRYAKNLKLIYVFNPKLNYDSFLTVVLREFTKEIPDAEVEKADLLHRYLVAYYEKNINVVIVIDEAQNTPAETLESMRMLSNIETTKHKLVQIVLAGQPELETVLASHSLRQLRQRLALNIRLNALSRQESLEYIAHRTMRAGATDQLFSDAALDWIVDHGEGIPRKINMICDNALITGFGSDQFPIGIDVLKEIEPDLKLLGVSRTGKWPQRLGPATFDEMVTENSIDNPSADDSNEKDGSAVGSSMSVIHPAPHKLSAESIEFPEDTRVDVENAVDAVLDQHQPPARGVGIDKAVDSIQEMKSSVKDQIKRKVLGDSARGGAEIDGIDITVSSNGGGEGGLSGHSNVTPSLDTTTNEQERGDYGTVRIVPRDSSALKGTSESHSAEQIEKFEKRLESQTNGDWAGDNDLLFETRSNLFNHTLIKNEGSGQAESSVEKSDKEAESSTSFVADASDQEIRAKIESDDEHSPGMKESSISSDKEVDAKRDGDEEDDLDPVAYVRTNRVVKASRSNQRFKKFW